MFLIFVFTNHEGAAASVTHSNVGRTTFRPCVVMRVVLRRCFVTSCSNIMIIPDDTEGCHSSSNMKMSDT